MVLLFGSCTSSKYFVISWFDSFSLSWSVSAGAMLTCTVSSSQSSAARVVESFDREFRILYAASLPIPDAWKTGKPATEPKTLKKIQPVNMNKIELSEFVSSPPPPPTDSHLDWEAMGVIQRFSHNPSPPDAAEEPFHHRHLLDRHPGRWEPHYNDFNNRHVQRYQEDGKWVKHCTHDVLHDLTVT